MSIQYRLKFDLNLTRYDEGDDGATSHSEMWKVPERSFQPRERPDAEHGVLLLQHAIDALTELLRDVYGKGPEPISGVPKALLETTGGRRQLISQTPKPEVNE